MTGCPLRDGSGGRTGSQCGIPLLKGLYPIPVKDIQIFWSSAGYQAPPVDDHFCIYPGGPGISEIRPEGRIGREVTAPHQTGFNNQLGTVTNGCYRFSRLEKLNGKIYAVL